MVPKKSLKTIRSCIPIFALLALIALFLKMPAAPDLFGIFKCSTCISNDPYLPLIGAGYFSILLAISLLFPSFPKPLLAKGGVIWAILLACTLTYIELPGWCIACLIGHTCNILIWVIWWKTPKPAEPPRSSFNERLFLTLMAPAMIIAFFSSLNLTLLVYQLKTQQYTVLSGLQIGDAIPSFTLQTDSDRLLTQTNILSSERTIINFVSPNCPFCKEQLQILNPIALQFKDNAYRCINIASSLSPELLELAQACEWIADQEGKLRELFKVSGYPTLFIVDQNGKILEILAGVSEKFKLQLEDFLKVR